MSEQSTDAEPAVYEQPPLDEEWHDLSRAKDCACPVCYELRECLAWALEQAPQTNDDPWVKRCHAILALFTR